MEAGGIREIPVHSAQFCCEPKTALKNSLIKQIRKQYFEPQNNWVRSVLVSFPFNRWTN